MNRDNEIIVDNIDCVYCEMYMATRAQLDKVLDMDVGEECIVGPWKFARTSKDSYWADRLDKSVSVFGDDIIIKYSEWESGYNEAYVYVCDEGRTSSIILYELVEDNIRRIEKLWKLLRRMKIK